MTCDNAVGGLGHGAVHAGQVFAVEEGNRSCLLIFHPVVIRGLELSQSRFDTSQSRIVHADIDQLLKILGLCKKVDELQGRFLVLARLGDSEGQHVLAC